MKKIFTSISAVALMLAATQSFAQVRVGFEAGVNLPTVAISLEEGELPSEMEPKMSFGFQAGVNAEILVNENFSIEPGLFFSQKGFKQEYSLSMPSMDPKTLKMTTTTIDIKHKAVLNYMEIPVNAVIILPVGDLDVVLKAGPYAAFAVSGSSQVGDEDAESYTFDDEDGLKRLDFGLNGGAGVEFSNITFNVKYGFGLANITDADGSSTANRNLGITLGYKIGDKK